MSTVLPPDDTAELRIVRPDEPGPSLADTQAVDVTDLARMAIGWADEVALEPGIDVPLDEDPTTEPEPEPEPTDAAVDPRIEARIADVADDRRRSRRRVVAWFVALAFAGAAAVVAVYSPLFDVDRIEIVGTELITRADLATETGLRIGDPTLLVDVDGIEARLRRDPRFARVVVVRELPDAISVRLTDRRLIARVVGPHRAAVVGENGVVIGKAQGDELLRSIEVSDDPPTRPGARLPKKYADAVDVMGSFSYEIAAQIEKVTLTSEGELVFELLGKRTVKFGTVADADRKLVAVRTMLGPQVDNSRLCELDVRVPTAPTIRRNPDCDPPPPPPDPVIDPATGQPMIDPATGAPVTDPAAAAAAAAAAAGAPTTTVAPTAPVTTVAPTTVPVEPAD